MPLSKISAKADENQKNHLLLEDNGNYIYSNGNYNSENIIKDFYKNNSDLYDFLLIASNFDVPTQPSFLPIQKDIKGISAQNINVLLSEWGINSKKLLGVVNMKNISSLTMDENDILYYTDWPRTVVHEITHYWGVNYGAFSDEKYGHINDGGGHWDRNVLLPSILMGGNNIQSWKDEGNGYIKLTPTSVNGEENILLDPFMLYSAGFICPDEIKDEKYIITNPNAEKEIMRYLTIQNIIDKEGERSPNCQQSKKNFKMGIVFLTKKGAQPSSSELDKLDYLADKIPEWWALAIDNKSTMTIAAIDPLPLCAENDWSYSLSPEICSSSKMQDKNWRKTKECNGGVYHPNRETVNCVPYSNSENNQVINQTKNDSFILKLERTISELSQKVIDLEKRLVEKVDTALSERLKGRILLQVENNGEAWYVDPISENKFYMQDGLAAYDIMRALGLGISNKDLENIPIGLQENIYALQDSDGDGIPDNLEVAIGTDPNKADTDGDGYNDKDEILNGYKPNSAIGKYAYNQSLINRLKGRIALQVESHGEAWYINPSDGKRYYLGDGNTAYNVMRFLSLGITNDNLRKIQVGEFSE